MLSTQLRFESGELRIAESFKDRMDTPQVIMTLLLKAWDFRTWSDSRWISLGKSCRTLVLSLLLGLQDLVGFVLKQPHTSTYYLSGFPGHCTDKVKMMCTIVSMSSSGADQSLLLVMEDDRLPLVAADVVSALETSMHFTEHMDSSVWKVLASLCSCSAAELRHICVSASLTAAGAIGFEASHVKAIDEVAF